MPTDSLSPLLTPEGWALLAELEPFSDEQVLALNTQLRKRGFSADLIAAALSQVRLRHKAEKKFPGFAESMLFTPDGLQQATRLPVAAIHAQRFVQAGVSSVADLGCGIGADALAMAAAGLKVTAVDADETTAAAATINLMAFPNATVQLGLAEEFDPATVEGLWLDPARRHTKNAGDRRLFDPESFSPPLSFVLSLAASGAPLGVKLGPALPHDAIADDAEAQWVSVDGELVEVSLWFNRLKRSDVTRSALIITEGNHHELTSKRGFCEPDEPEVPLGKIERYIYEPDSAVIRAGLVADLARLTGAHLIDEHIAYLSSQNPVDTVFARGYEVLDLMPFNVKTMRDWVRSHNVGVVEIKKRGVDVVPEQLRKQLLAKQSRSATESATFLLTRLGKPGSEQSRVAAVVRAL